MSCPFAHTPQSNGSQAQTTDGGASCPFSPSSQAGTANSRSHDGKAAHETYDQSVLKPIPQPPEHLYGLLGNIPDVDPEFFASSLWHFADLYGPIYRLNLINRNTVVLNTYKLAYEVMDDDRFEKFTMGQMAVVRNGLGNGLFTAQNSDPNWGKAHRLLMPVFGPMGVRKMLPEMIDVAQQMIMGWDRLGPDNEVDAANDFTRLAFDTIGLCGYGYRFNEFLNGLHPFAARMADFLKESGRIGNRTTLETQMRVFSARKYQADIQFMLDVVEEMVAKRRAHPEPDRHDFLNTMLYTADPLTGEKLDDTCIRYNMVTFLVAGHETTSSALSFLFYYLLKNPDKLMKAQKQVDEVLGNDVLEIKHISRLTYLDACLREAMRLKGPITQVIRTPKQPTVIGGCYEVKPGEAITINSHKVHVDPAVWGDDAEEYKPERMLDMDKIPPGAWRPFGVGARSCIGRSFAEQEMLAATALALQRFQIEMVNPQYSLVLKSTMTVKPDNFSFKVRRRPGKDLMVGFGGSAPSAGLAVHEKHHESKSSKDTKEVLVYYGSNAGTCRAFADELNESATAKGYRTKIQPLDTATEQLKTNAPVVIITSSYEGKPPDNAKKFVSWLEANKSQTKMLSDCRYAVFGVGNNEWVDTFQKVPRLVDQLMAEEGAKKICEAGYADVKENAIGSWESWQDRFWKAVQEHGFTADATPQESTKLVTKVMHSKAAGILAGGEVSHGIVRSNALLADNSVGPAKKLMEVELPAGTKYRSGDYIVILPLNPPSQVARVLTHFGLNNEDVIEMSGTKKSFLQCDPTTTAYNLFAARVELGNTVTQRQLDVLIESASNADDKGELQKIRADEASYKAACIDKHLSILDILDDYPSCKLDLAQFIDMLKPLSPRQYSISSSPLYEMEPLETHDQPLLASITYDVHESPAWSGHERVFHGVASSYLSNLTPGNQVRCFLRNTNAAFHLPADPKTPVIMMAAGTGIAPMRGFIQERSAIAKVRGSDVLGPALLYFGCRDYEKDYIHRNELETWEKEGVVSVRPSFSKRAPEDNKNATSGCHYVPDRVWAEKDEVADLFVKGAKIFVCGSASKLAKSNAEALRRIYLDKTPSATEKDAVVWLDGIKEERYVSDVFE